MALQAVEKQLFAAQVSSIIYSKMKKWKKFEQEHLKASNMKNEGFI
jgi:hypothetical protein